MARLFVFIGALNGALAVLLGAFGAHVLKKTLSAEMLTVYQTGVQYHVYHALGLLALGVLMLHSDSALLKWSGWGMFAGVVLFSGSLYLLAVSGIRALGAITPFGGVLFVLAWILLAVAAWKGLNIPSSL